MTIIQTINELSKKVEIREKAKSIISEIEKEDSWSDIGYTKHTTSEKPIIKKTRINLNVPYNQRESAKRAGARWDAGIRKWYMMVTNDDLKKIPNAWR